MMRPTAVNEIEGCGYREGTGWKKNPTSIYDVIIELPLPQNKFYFVAKIVLTYCQKKNVLEIKKNF